MSDSIGKKVLLVDDEEALASLFCHFLNHAGYDCVQYSSPSMALDYFSQHPDSVMLLVTDNSMPQMTGEVLLREMRKLRADLPVILASGYTESLDVDDLQSINVKVLEKPFGRAELLEAVAAVLGR